MKTILQQLYNGQIYPAESINPNTRKYSKLKEHINEEMKIIRQKLSPEDIERLEKIEEDQSIITGIDMFYGFKEGFRLGLLIIYEALTDKQNVLDRLKGNVSFKQCLRETFPFCPQTVHRTVLRVFHFVPFFQRFFLEKALQKALAGWSVSPAAAGDQRLAAGPRPGPAAPDPCFYMKSQRSAWGAPSTELPTRSPCSAA